MKINHLAFVIASMFTAEAFAASNLLITKTAAGLTVTRSPHTPKISSGATVTLTAQGVAVGSVATWSGSAVNCSNGLTCTFTMPNNVTTVNLSSVKVATPKPIPPKPKPIPIINYNLKTSVSPSGAGTVSGGGSYNANSRVTVTQISNKGYAFFEWSDASCGKSTTCRLVLNSNKNLTAKFVPQLPAPTPTTPNNGKIDVLPNVRFTVATLTGASKYQLVVAKQGVQLSLDGLWGACANLDATQCKQTELQTSNIFTSGFSDLLKKDGSQWQWLVRGYDKDGVAGKWSTARTFTMAGAGLDISAYVEKMKKMGKIAGNATPPYQCVALARHYATDVLKTSLASSDGQGGAYDIFVNSTSTSNYEKVNYKEGLIPTQGDIVFFKRSSANKQAGHVAIVISVDNIGIKPTTLTLLEQNYCSSGLANGKGDCAIRENQSRTFDGVAGWLHIIKK